VKTILFVLATVYWQLASPIDQVAVRVSPGAVDVLRSVNSLAPDVVGLFRDPIGFKQTAVLFDRDKRHAGVTGYPLRKMLRFAADGILGFSVTPLRMITRMGSLISVLSFLGVLYVGGVKLFAPETAVPGWAFLGIAMFFLGGIQIIMLGVLGSYIGRTYSQVQNRPLYGVASVRTGQAAPAEARESAEAGRSAR